MNHLKSLFLSLLLTIFCGRFPAQDSDVNIKRRADSLKTALRYARSDSARIRLRYELGTVNSCRRPGYWDSLVTDARSCGSRFHEGRTLSAAARMLIHEPTEKKALDYNEQSYAIAQENGDRLGMIRCFITWASYYCYMRNNASTALDYCFKGLQLAAQINDERSRNTLMTLAGTSYFAAGDYQKALNMHLKCLKMARKLGNPNDIVCSLTDVGSDYHGMKQYLKSAEYYLECKKYLPELMNNPNVTEIINSISSGHLSRQQYDSGYKYANMAMILAKKTNKPRTIASAMVSLAGAQYSLGNYTAAKKTATEALELIKPLHAPLLTVLLTSLLEMICLQQGDYKDALDAYKLQVKSKDTLANETHRKRLMEMEFNYNLEKKESENRLLAAELKQNKYFQIIMALLGLFVFIVSYLFYRQNKLRSEQESNRLSQKLLRVQMNPHFIFNSLQAIQGFIVNRDVRESVHYLGAFSLVTRHVLENSRTDYIPINKEIDLLKNYLQLQQLRFMNRFDYFVHVDEGINSSFINIPPMLLQPFIENAVEHGMHDIQSGGRIEVWYRMDENLFFMEIIDNGYGMTGRGQHKKRYRSLAFEITRERIALMNRREKTKSTFTITDAFPDEAERKGVKVVFRFSLNELKKWT
jgi:tetratricopeptide (TPR) repeat protein